MSSEVWALAARDSSLWSASEDGSIRRWCQRRLMQVQVLRGHGGAVHQVLCLDFQELLCSGSLDGTMRLWRNDGTLKTKLQGHEVGRNGAFEGFEANLRLF